MRNYVMNFVQMLLRAYCLQLWSIPKYSQDCLREPTFLILFHGIDAAVLDNSIEPSGILHELLRITAKEHSYLKLGEMSRENFQS